MGRLTLPESVNHWSMRSVQIKLIKMGGRPVRHDRRLVFQLSEVVVSREVFRSFSGRIGVYRRAPTGTMVTNILEVISGEER